MSIGATLALLIASALPAAAHTLTVTISADCTCKYSVSISGSTQSGPGAIGVDYSFIVTENGNTSLVTGHIDATADDNGNFSATQSNLALPTPCAASVSFSNSSASLTFNGSPDSGTDITFTLPSTLTCSGGPPPSGKSLEIGPSSMEGRVAPSKLENLPGWPTFRGFGSCLPAGAGGTFKTREPSWVAYPLRFCFSQRVGLSSLRRPSEQTADGASHGSISISPSPR